MTQFFFVLLLSGIILIAAEIFIPGGVLGFIGVLALVGAIIMSFAIFGAQYGVFIAVGIVLLLVLSLFLWVKYFPKSPLGKAMTLSQDMSAKPRKNDKKTLLGKKGRSQSTLRPAGIAIIDGKRVDVVAESAWIDHDKPVRVIHVEGNIVTVREEPELNTNKNSES
ncbi:MAG: hypothetical protein EOM20_10780 [Spartobacteria bacterium]|nr:hypothetical protein [Spartobacteria bacterium]